jgi:DeoR/GlpR family transcriptional regulator of sugar metabolism
MASESSPMASGAPLFTHERRQQIAHILEAQQRVTVSELSRLFSVSEVTIRKDLAWLETQKVAVRTHGGAVAVVAGTNEMGFDVREHLQQTEKDRIGSAAADSVQNGETIFIDASTTGLAMAQLLKTRRDLTVVTNGLRSGMILVGLPGISVLIPGGILREESFSLVGTWGTAVLKQIHISRAFLGARGFTFNEGLTDVNGEEVELKRAIVASAREVVAIIDHSKWGEIALATFCPIERIKMIITDINAPDAMVAQARSMGIEILMA